MTIKLTDRAACIMPDLNSWHAHGWTDFDLIACGYAIDTSRKGPRHSSLTAQGSRWAIHSQGGQRAEDVVAVAKAQLSGQDIQLIVVDDETNARQKLSAFLHSVRTRKALIERAPELERFLPPEARPAMPLVVPTDDTLRTLKELGMK